MNILIDARLYGLEHAGPGRYVMNLVDELARIDRSNEYTILLRKEYFNRLKLPTNFKIHHADYRQYTFTEQIVLPITLYKIKPDLVHFPHLNVPVLYFGKFIVTLHDMIMHAHKGGEATTRPFPIYQIWRFGYHLSFLKAVRNAVKIITPSYAVKKELINYYNIEPKKIMPIYEGVDNRIKSANDPEKILKKYGLTSEKYFLFVGSAYPHKNLERVIQAIVQLNKETNLNIKFAIVSSRSVFTQRLIQKINSYGADKYVKLLGFVPDDELGVLYKKSLAFVYPSLSEGFGLPGLEAISSGTLVIVSNIEVFNEVYDEHAIKVDPFNIDSLMKGMQKVLDMTKPERQKRVLAGQKFIARYSWDKMAHDTLKIYKSVE